MFSSKDLPSASSMFSAYASMAASMMLVRSMANDFIPSPIRSYLLSTLTYLFCRRSDKLTLVIEESNGITNNEVYEASQVYLSTKVSPDTERLRISKSPKEKNFTVGLEKDEKIVDHHQGIELNWKFVCVELEKDNRGESRPSRMERKYFELSFDKKHKEKVLGSYLPSVLNKAKILKDDERVLKMHTLGNSLYSFDRFRWESINLEHPATFETLAMEPEQKNAIIEDLNRFVKRKEFYKRVGRAWKRGYLLYGPPGTGKSSLIAAIANYLKFDIYDLQLTNISSDSDLRKLLLATANRSILVIEDIDCSVQIPERFPNIEDEDGRKRRDVQLTLSGLLNFIDGLWSSCGDERIIIFTTNHKERLDPALLRPGRMDMHIHMSYCTSRGFRHLASNYLGINHHHLFGEIENLMENTRITPAQVAEELMKSEHVDIALEGLVKVLKRKKMEDDEIEDGAKINKALQQGKRQKVEAKGKRPSRITRRKGSRRQFL